MSKPQEICVVTALGQKYDSWDTVEVHHNTMEVVDHAMLTVAEISTAGTSLNNLKLKPGDHASVSLAGEVVLDGTVYLRQASCDANSHQVQIGIASLAQPIVESSVGAKSGTYKNQTIQSIGSAVAGKMGVKFSVLGNPGGADLPFPSVSEHVGETIFGFLERLCRMRNLFMIDDGQGGINAFRGPQGTAAPIQEGRNMQRGRILLRNDESKDLIKGVGQNPRQSSADASRDSSAQASVASLFGSTGLPQRLQKFILEDAVDTSSAQMRVDHEAACVLYDEVDGVVTVPGWLCDDGSLWMHHVRKIIPVYSPLLVPGDTMEFMIKGVIHRQNVSDGTTTDIQLCQKNGLGAYGDNLAPDASSTSGSDLSGSNT
jgi:prophage tail gpP-like protein